MAAKCLGDAQGTILILPILRQIRENTRTYLSPQVDITEYVGGGTALDYDLADRLAGFQNIVLPLHRLGELLY